jgi:hypothetical protein
MSRNERQTVASEQPFGVPSVCVRFILARFEFRFRNRPPLTMIETV